MIMILVEGSIYGDVFILIFTEKSIFTWNDYDICQRINIWRRVHFDIYKLGVLLHKMIMIFDKGSIYGDVFILIFTEYCYIKYVMIFDQRIIYGDVFILIFTEYCYIKWLMIFVKGSIYGDVYILIFTEESIFYIKWLWYLIKDQYMEMCVILIFTEWSIVT